MWQRYEFFSKKAYLCSMNNEKKYLLGLTLAELKQVAKDLGMPAFTGGQMAKWLYEQHVKSIDAPALVDLLALIEDELLLLMPLS